MRNIPATHEVTHAPIPVEVWHGGRDPYTHIDNLSTLRGGDQPITVKAFPELSHGLSPLIDAEIIARLCSVLSPNPEKKRRRMKQISTPEL